MEKKYVLRDYRVGDEEGLIRLLELVFSGWPHLDLPCSPLDHWKWKFEDNPQKNNVIPIAESGDLIIGSNHSFPLTLKLFDEVYMGSQSTDLATHPDYRNMGVYRSISDFKTELYKKRNYAFSYAITSNPIVFDTAMKMGRNGFPHKISTLIRVKDVDLHLKMKQSEDALLKKFGAQFLIQSGRLRNVVGSIFSSSSAETDFKMRDIKIFNEGFTSFWDDVKGSYDFIIERNIEYLNWRYCDPRGGNFTVKVAESEGKYLGFIVLRINRYNASYPEGYIADLLTVPERPDVASKLIKEANSFFDESNVNIIYYWVVNGHPYEDIMKREGFFDSRFVPYFIFQNVSIGSTWDGFQKIPPHRMHYQYGDSDWI